MEKAANQSLVGCKPLTTFVQTDTTTFREVVQRLTGPSESHTPPSKAAGSSKRPIATSKLHERRHLTRPKLQIVKPAASHFFKPTSCISSEHPSCTSSPLGTPSKILSKLSIGDGEKELNAMEEEKAIKERRFYLHPSPRSMPGYAQPELLTLFPLESPKTSQKPSN
ncbi:VQ motif-containing protein 31 [Momordica charantia]|uniref:VQ motif-containing protein 31 n=1 Tax=Momordica charantia TaxID=3673 RepID=A0A6J1D5K7_MOMCH|nr:VQ motif-containing protein 31 [Momordica charantia]